jgi:hypothetical protein
VPAFIDESKSHVVLLLSVEENKIVVLDHDLPIKTVALLGSCVCLFKSSGNHALTISLSAWRVVRFRVLEAASRYLGQLRMC